MRWTLPMRVGISHISGMFSLFYKQKTISVFIKKQIVYITYIKKQIVHIIYLLIIICFHWMFFVILLHMYDELVFFLAPSEIHSVKKCPYMYLSEMILDQIPDAENTLHMFFMIRALLKAAGSMMPHPPSSMVLDICDHLTR